MNPVFRVAGAILAVTLSLVLSAQAAELPATELPEAKDFRADAAEAKRAGLPILVFFTTRDCPYCHIVHEDYLKPMYLSGKYKDKILFRMVRVDEDITLRDFAGGKTTHREFAARAGARLTPQVRFLDDEGKELVPALLGLMTQDFYAGILEGAIDNAVTRMRRRAGMSSPLS